MYLKSWEGVRVCVCVHGCTHTLWIQSVHQEHTGTCRQNGLVSTVEVWEAMWCKYWACWQLYVSYRVKTI